MSSSKVVLAARAVRHKLRAVTALETFWPAVVRGGKLLARGRFRQFTGKLFNETASVRAADAAPTRTGPPLVLAGHILRSGGYDTVVFALLKGLLEAGVNVVRDPGSVMKYELIPESLRPAEATREGPHSRLAATPPHLLDRFHPDRRTAAFTMWETDTLPANAVQALNRCGLVVVPSQWGAACFRANGVTVPIEVVPLGYDPEMFGRDVKRSTPAYTVFGTAGALDDGGFRKNVQRTIELFRTAFPNEPEVRLRVKITPASPPVQTHGDSRIEVIRHSLAPAELAEWYRSLSAFVNASFGEGFGLHLLEAMACGRPIVSSTFGGVGEFFDASVGYEVGYRLIEANNAIYRGRWAEPDDGELIAAMRRIHSDPVEADRLGERSAERALRFTWADTTRQLIEVLVRRGFLRETA